MNSSTPQEDFAARSVTLEEAKQAQFVVDVTEDTWHKSWKLELMPKGTSFAKSSCSDSLVKTVQVYDVDEIVFQLHFMGCDVFMFDMKDMKMD